MRRVRHVFFKREVMNEWKGRRVKCILVFLVDIIEFRLHVRYGVEIEFVFHVQVMPLSRPSFRVDEPVCKEKLTTTQEVLRGFCTRFFLGASTPPETRKQFPCCP